MLEVGKLYSCSKYFVLLYPDREAADATFGAAATAAYTYTAAAAEAAASYWSRKLSKPVSYCDAAAPLLVLNTDNEYVEVLVGDKRVWIINQDWLEIKEIR